MADRAFANLIASPARLAVVVLFSLCTAGAAGLAAAQSSGNPDRAKAIAAADAEIRSAQNQLEEARRRFEVGRKASNVDRVNQLEGGGAYTDAYYLRVEALKSDVTKAQDRLDRAITARKALE